MTNKENYKL